VNDSANPFSTRRIRPGAIDFHFPHGETCRSLVERLRQNNWWGEIIGDHGSGKSSLLASLVPAIQRDAHRTVSIELHDGRSRLPLKLRQLGRLAAPTVVVVDGYEQLGYWNRLRLKRFCRRRGLGLVVTAHATVGFPELFRTVSDTRLAWLLVDRLMHSYQRLLCEQDVLDAYSRQEGNIRETLFDLYDVYESRRRKQAPPA
jgi:hypothetical protein